MQARFALRGRLAVFIGFCLYFRRICLGSDNFEGVYNIYVFNFCDCVYLLGGRVYLTSMNALPDRPAKRRGTLR